MLGGNRRRAAGIALAALVAVLAFAGSAFASGGDRVIRVQDACDPATFDAVLGSGACARPDHSGRFVTFDDFVDRVTKKRSHNAWRFDSAHVTIQAGQELTVEMGRGGEFHTFSDVTETGFGPGCVPFLNLLVFPGQDQTPVITCPANLADLPNGVAPGAPALHFRLSPGTHLFQCAIHPWMRSTVTVR